MDPTATRRTSFSKKQFLAWLIDARRLHEVDNTSWFHNKSNRIQLLQTLQKHQAPKPPKPTFPTMTQVPNREDSCIKSEGMRDPIFKANFHAASTTGDGFCFYNAVSILLFGSEKYALCIRYHALMLALSQWDFYSNRFDSHRQGRTLEKTCMALLDTRGPYAWASYSDAELISNMYKVPIHVINSTGPTFATGCCYLTQQPILHILHAPCNSGEKDNHFVAAVPLHHGGTHNIAYVKTLHTNARQCRKSKQFKLHGECHPPSSSSTLHNTLHQLVQVRHHLRTIHIAAALQEINALHYKQTWTTDSSTNTDSTTVQSVSLEVQTEPPHRISTSSQTVHKTNGTGTQTVSNPSGSAVTGTQTLSSTSGHTAATQTVPKTGFPLKRRTSATSSLVQEDNNKENNINVNIPVIPASRKRARKSSDEPMTGKQIKKPKSMKQEDLQVEQEKTKNLRKYPMNDTLRKMTWTNEMIVTKLKCAADNTDNVVIDKVFDLKTVKLNTAIFVDWGSNKFGKPDLLNFKPGSLPWERSSSRREKYSKDYNNIYHRLHPEEQPDNSKIYYIGYRKKREPIKPQPKDHEIIHALTYGAISACGHYAFRSLRITSGPGKSTFGFTFLSGELKDGCCLH